MVFTKALWVKHEDCKQVRTVRPWHSRPGSLTAFFWQRAEMEKMWEARTDVFFKNGFPMIDDFFARVCLLCVLCACIWCKRLLCASWVRQAAFSCTLAQLNPLVPVQACYYCCISMLIETSFLLFFKQHQVCIHVGGPRSSWENMVKINIWRFVTCELLSNLNVAEKQLSVEGVI